MIHNRKTLCQGWHYQGLTHPTQGVFKYRRYFNKSACLSVSSRKIIEIGLVIIIEHSGTFYDVSYLVDITKGLFKFLMIIFETISGLSHSDCALAHTPTLSKETTLAWVDFYNFKITPTHVLKLFLFIWVKGYFLCVLGRPIWLCFQKKILTLVTLIC